MGFSSIGKGNQSHMVLLNTPLHVEAVTNESKLPWHKYLKGKSSKNNHPYNPPASLSPALENTKVVTELMAGLYIYIYIYRFLFLKIGGGFLVLNIKFRR